MRRRRLWRWLGLAHERQINPVGSVAEAWRQKGKVRAHICKLAGHAPIRRENAIGDAGQIGAVLGKDTHRASGQSGCAGGGQVARQACCPGRNPIGGACAEAHVAVHAECIGTDVQRAEIVERSCDGLAGRADPQCRSRACDQNTRACHGARVDIVPQRRDACTVEHDGTQRGRRADVAAGRRRTAESELAAPARSPPNLANDVAGDGQFTARVIHEGDRLSVDAAVDGPASKGPKSEFLDLGCPGAHVALDRCSAAAVEDDRSPSIGGGCHIPRQTGPFGKMEASVGREAHSGDVIG